MSTFEAKAGIGQRLTSLAAMDAASSRQVKSVGWSLLSDYQQCYEGNEIEDDKENPEHRESRVDDHVVGFSGNREKLALCAKREIRGKHKDNCPHSQNAAT